MLLTSVKNEFPFYPNIQENLSLPENERFTVIMRKLSFAIHSPKWTTHSKEGHISVEPLAYIKEHIVRFENAPDIQEESKLPGAKGKIVKLTPEILLSGVYPVLNDIVEQIYVYAGELDGIRGIETKES